MITSRIQKQVSIPHEPGEWFKFRMLSGRQLEEAGDAQQARYLSVAKLLGSEVFDSFRKESNEEPVQADATPEDITRGYHVDTVLKYGVIGWSYPEKITPQTLGDLDDVTRAWAAREILTLTLPKPEDAKND